MWTYIVCPELPQPPQWLLDQVDPNLNPEKNNTGYLQEEPLTDWRGYSGPAALNVRVTFNNEYEQWVYKNITQETVNTSLNYVTNTHIVGTTTPHRDFTRDYVLIYNVDVGGPAATLNFFQEKGQDIERAPGTACGRYKDLVLLDSVVGPAGCWYLANATLLHNTDFMTQTRINLQVSFKKGSAFAEQIIARA